MITEISGDMFKHTDNAFIAHCVSGDFALGAGVAKEINNRYNMKIKLERVYGKEESVVGRALRIENVFNLVDKDKCKDRARLSDLESALFDMKRQCYNWGIKELIMPRVGCGRDRLKWSDVRKLIYDIFDNSDIDITIYVR